MMSTQNCEKPVNNKSILLITCLRSGNNACKHVSTYKTDTQQRSLVTIDIAITVRKIGGI